MGRILIVDDETFVLAAIERVLRRAGHEVVATNNGIQALEAAETTQFDAAIVDFNMPGPDGLAVLRQLFACQPRCMRILASGALDLPLTMEAVNQGWICKIVAKPFTPKILRDAVAGCLQARLQVEEYAGVARAAEAREQARLLAECMAGEQLQLAIQPIVCAQTLTPVAYEALLRSSHPVLDGPAPVLGAAEAAGALGALGDVVVERAAEWLGYLPRPVKLFINLHPDELADPEALDARLARLAGLEERVVLEITERSQLDKIDGWERSVALARKRGFAIAVDDLGAGYSSLSILADLRPDYVKVDMSIVRGCDEDEHRQRILALLCQFAEADGAILIAEGIETEAEAETARRCGAHLLQGYWIGRPALRETSAMALATVAPQPSLLCAAV